MSSVPYSWKKKRKKKSELNKYNPDKPKKNHQSLENTIWEENLNVLVKLSLKKNYNKHSKSCKFVKDCNKRRKTPVASTCPKQRGSEIIIGLNCSKKDSNLMSQKS